MGFGDNGAEARREARERENRQIARENAAIAKKEAEDKLAKKAMSDTGTFANQEAKLNDKKSVLDDDGDDDNDNDATVNTVGSPLTIKAKKKKKAFERFGRNKVTNQNNVLL